MVGTRFVRMKLRIAVHNPAKPGNAENTVKAMVSKGTSDNNMVNVRLPATCINRSSRKRTDSRCRNWINARIELRTLSTVRLGRVISALKVLRMLRKRAGMEVGSGGRAL